MDKELIELKLSAIGQKCSTYLFAFGFNSQKNHNPKLFGFSFKRYFLNIVFHQKRKKDKAFKMQY